MKISALLVVFCLIGANAHSIGRPTNVFGTYKIVSQKVVAKQQFKPDLKPQLTIEKGVRVGQRVFSVVNYVINFAAKK